MVPSDHDDDCECVVCRATRLGIQTIGGFPLIDVEPPSLPHFAPQQRRQARRLKNIARLNPQTPQPENQPPPAAAVTPRSFLAQLRAIFKAVLFWRVMP